MEFTGGAASVLDAACLSVWRRRQRQQRVLRPGVGGGGRGGCKHHVNGDSSRNIAPVHSALLPWPLAAGTTAQHTRSLLHYCHGPEDKKTVKKLNAAEDQKGAQTWRLMNDFMWVLASATALRHVSNNARLQHARAIDNGSAIEHSVKATCGSEKPTLCPTRQLFEPKLNAASVEALQHA